MPRFFVPRYWAAAPGISKPLYSLRTPGFLPWLLSEQSECCSSSEGYPGYLRSSWEQKFWAIWLAWLVCVWGVVLGGPQVGRETCKAGSRGWLYYVCMGLRKIWKCEEVKTQVKFQWTLGAQSLHVFRQIENEDSDKAVSSGMSQREKQEKAQFPRLLGSQQSRAVSKQALS